MKFVVFIYTFKQSLVFFSFWVSRRRKGSRKKQPCKKMKSHGLFRHE